jgi:hypothetical protein
MKFQIKLPSLLVSPSSPLCDEAGELLPVEGVLEKALHAAADHFRIPTEGMWERPRMRVRGPKSRAQDIAITIVISLFNKQETRLDGALLTQIAAPFGLQSAAITATCFRIQHDLDFQPERPTATQLRRDIAAIHMRLGLKGEGDRAPEVASASPRQDRAAAKAEMLAPLSQMTLNDVIGIGSLYFNTPRRALILSQNLFNKWRRDRILALAIDAAGISIEEVSRQANACAYGDSQAWDPAGVAQDAASARRKEMLAEERGLEAEIVRYRQRKIDTLKAWAKDDRVVFPSPSSRPYPK